MAVLVDANNEDITKIISVKLNSKQEQRTNHVVAPITATATSLKHRKQPIRNTKKQKKNKQSNMRVIPKFWTTILITQIEKREIKLSVLYAPIIIKYE